MKVPSRNSSIAFMALVLFCLSFTMFLNLSGVLGNEKAYAAENPSGTSGTVDWEIDEGGALVLTPSDGATEGTLASFGYAETGVGAPWYDHRQTITSFKIAEGKTVYGEESITYMFYECKNLVSVNLEGFDTSNVENMRDMFSRCTSLPSLDVSTLDTSNVTNFRGMFYDCESLTSLDVSMLDTSNGVNMIGVFHDCGNLISLDLTNFDTSKATDTSWMFYGCLDLTSITLSERFDTSNVTDMSYMFYKCTSLDSLELPGSFVTSKVTTLNRMFVDCLSLNSLDLTGFYIDGGSLDTSFLFHNVPLIEVVIGETTNASVKSAIPLPRANIVVDVPAGIVTQGGEWQDGVGGVYTSLSSVGAGTYTATNNAPLDISSSNTTIEVSIDPTEASYTGLEIKPAVTIKNAATGFDLIEGTHYTLSYENNINVAKSTDTHAPRVTITAMGYCSGEQSTTFTINAADITSATIADIPNKTYDGMPYTPSPTVELNGVVLETPRDYTLQYLDASGAVIASPTEAGTYTAKFSGAGGYTGSIARVFTIEQASIVFATTSKIPDFDYSCKPCTPNPQIELNGVILESPRDYTIEYFDSSGTATIAPVSAGAYTVELTGVGNYTGMQNSSFIINPASIASASVSEIPDHVYDHQPYTPEPDVVVNGTELESPRDYTIEYFSESGMPTAFPTEEGTYTEVFTGVGNYTDTSTVTFEIVDPSFPDPIPSPDADKTNHPSSKEDSSKILPSTGDSAASAVILLALSAAPSALLIAAVRKYSY